MIKILLQLVFIFFYLEALEKPHAEFQASGSVTDLLYQGKKLYAATDASSVDIFDVESKKLLERIKVSQITDFMGDVIDSKVYSIDLIANKILILSQGKKGARRIHIYENNKLDLVLSDTKKLFIAKAKFINKDTLILGLLSNEIISYDINKQKQNYRVQISQSKFSNFALSEDKQQIIVADESGDLKIHNTATGKYQSELCGQNLDNVFAVAIKNGIIATAGQDRRAVIYKLKSNKAYFKTSSFLIYSVGLSPSGKIAGYSSDEQNSVTVFNTDTRKKIGIYGPNKMTPTSILFIDEDNFFVSTDNTTINQFKIK